VCACGHKRPEVVTTVQAEQEFADRAALVAELERQAVREAEVYARSAANAVGNANS